LKNSDFGSVGLMVRKKQRNSALFSYLIPSRPVTGFELAISPSKSTNDNTRIAASIFGFYQIAGPTAYSGHSAFVKVMVATLNLLLLTVMR